MSVEETDIVDIISTDPNTGEVLLTITDDLDWSDSSAHQLLLQKKLNTYLAFVESREILDQYPDAKDRPVVFRVVFKRKPDAPMQEFLSKAKQIVETSGYSLRYEQFAASYDN